MLIPWPSVSSPSPIRVTKGIAIIDSRGSLVICVCAVLCQATGPTAIARWANSRTDWLARYLTLPYGVPSRDCILRILIAFDRQAFQECFEAWLLARIGPNEAGERRMVAIDGKSCRGSRDDAKRLGPLWSAPEPFTARCNDLDKLIWTRHRVLRLNTAVSRTPPELDREMTPAVKAFVESLLDRLEALETKVRQARASAQSSHRPQRTCSK